MAPVRPNQLEERYPMQIITSHFKVNKASLPAFEAARASIMSAIAKEQPSGIRYTWCKLADGQTFVGILELEDGIENPLPKLSVGREFLENIKNWVSEPPQRQEMEVIGSFASIS